MKTLVLGGALFVFWSAYYHLLTVLHDEKIILIAFSFCLAVSMIIAALMLNSKK